MKYNNMYRIVRRFVFIFSDILCFGSAWFLAFFIDNSGITIDSIFRNYWFVVIAVIIQLCFNGLFGVYKYMWRYAGVMEVVSLFIAISMSTVTIFFIYLKLHPMPISGSVVVIAYLLLCVTMIGYRVSHRLYNRLLVHFKKIDRVLLHRTAVATVTRCLFVGAGETAASLLKEIQRYKREYTVIGIVDDDKAKVGRSLHGVPILGTTELISHFVGEYTVTEVVIAIPSATPMQIERIIKYCPSERVKIKLMPHLWDIDAVSLSSLREIDISDLLGRSEQKLDIADIKAYIQGKTVLVTGGGGSIGSEICRQLLLLDPAKLIIFDIYENSAYELQNELCSLFRSRNSFKITDKLFVRTGSVQDTMRLHEVFAEFTPDIVFHAAAYKHVPLMEQSPYLAIQNNVFGTRNTALMSSLFGVKKFVMISTDKAVNPTNVMGCSKRLAEYIVQSMNYFKGNKTEFVSVRFGNVLGSNGSVIPLFKKQIASGGPVTVTHPEITRYFMTIPEASRLVLKTGSIANGGEIFILDMGEPVKIVDLACKMIELSGHTPNVDIKIIFTGLRPGEKLYEELLLDEEGLKTTENAKIHVGHAKIFSETEIEILITAFTEAVAIAETNERTQEIKRLLHFYIPSYHEEALT